MTDAPQSQPQIILLCRDLIFATKIQGTAQALGMAVRCCGGFQSAAAALTDPDPEHPLRLVLVDLGDAAWNTALALAQLRAFTPSPVTLCGFGPHIDAAALDTARAAGFTLVLPRSRFSAELPDLLLAATQVTATNSSA
jgi:hypothetical protein